jgi:hypothetical protein
MLDPDLNQTQVFCLYIQKDSDLHVKKQEKAKWEEDNELLSTGVGSPLGYSKCLPVE